MEALVTYLAPQIVIVGGGIGGGALATVLARNGMEVVIVERETAYPDRVRGEFVAPWGVAEFKRLGLLELLYAHGAMHTKRNVPYDENWSSEQAERRALDLTKLHPEAPGPLCVGHPTMCNAFAEAAVSAGAVLLKGAKDVACVADKSPVVSFFHDGRRIELKPRLVVGADGRNSVIRKQVGFETEADEPHNLIGGMLVANVPEWPRDMQAIGTEDELHYLIFPQGKDLVRLYVCYDFANRARFAGPDKSHRVLQAFRLHCLPLASAILAGTPVGPFNSYSNEDHWVDNPTAPGVVLIGDAAGHNDPVTGQGVSITARDVRIVSEILLSNKSPWAQDAFASYVEERRERMRRLRIIGRLASQLRVEFGPDARKRRARVAQRFAEGYLSPLPATLVGPERLPPEAYLPATISRLTA
jgi:2-polyprenyl-6-methoxyphenol hydroxylase-like FAD-dependent oxidoreductase